MKTVAICTTWPTNRKKRRAIRPPISHPGQMLIGNQWVAEIEGDTVPVGEHNSPEAALLAARYLACNDDDITALISPDGAERYI
tara:strand:+ start:267 stop:518 length:252 start_codon:yes stop_codon:yes gene_type:complete